MLLDNQVFKLKDPRISVVMRGSMTVQTLANLILPGDCIILYKDTIYALTQDQYYAAQQLIPERVLSQPQFQTLLKEDLSFLSSDDLKTVQKIKKYKSNCSRCQYNTFKNQLLTILKRYPDKAKEYKLIQNIPEIKPYPETTGTIISKVSKLFPRFFSEMKYERKPCLDCVQKHVGQAYQKGCQVSQGYPEHFNLAVANLQQAYEQSPEDCQSLRELLMFCIGKSIKEHKPFIPLGSLQYLIQLSRAQTQQITANDTNKADDDFALELNQDVCNQLKEIPISVKPELLKQLARIIDIEYSEEDKQTSIEYQGCLANLANDLLPFSKTASNILRNRRIMFKVSPQLTRDTQYDCKDFIKAITSGKLG